MGSRLVGALVLLALVGCGDPDGDDTTDTGDTGDTSDTEDTDETGDTADTSADTSDTSDTDTGADTSDTSDTGADTADTGADTADTGFVCGGADPLDFCDVAPDASTGANWDFSQSGVLTGPTTPGFYAVPADQALAIVTAGACTILSDGAAPVFLVAGHAVPVDARPVTFHATVTDDAAGFGVLGVRFYDGDGEVVDTLASSESTTTGTGAWAFRADPGPDAAWARPFVEVVGASDAFNGIGTDAWSVRETVVFDATDHDMDPDAVRVATNAQTAEGSGGFFVEAALSDEAVLYVATQATHASDRDHFVFVWAGAPHATDLVAPPWAKNGAYPVAGPGAGNALFALAREGGSGHFCGWMRWSGTAWVQVTSTATCASGVPAGTPAAPRMEGALDLAAALGVAGYDDLPATLAFAAVPFDSSDGGNSWGEPFQTPHVPSDGDLGLDDDETAASSPDALHVDRLLVPEPFVP